MDLFLPPDIGHNRADCFPSNAGRAFRPRSAIKIWQLVTFLGLMLYAPQTPAADFSEQTYSKFHILNIAGELLIGDEHKFVKFIDKNRHKYVVLNTYGGALNTALIIGSGISVYGYSTVVGEQHSCTSVCALIWLFGNRRYLHRNAKLGFKALATRDEEGDVSRLSNGLIGAHLADLGINRKTLEFIMSLKSDEIRWLSFDDAIEIGLNVIPIGDVR